MLAGVKYLRQSRRYLTFNAGAGIWKSVEEITPEEFEQSWRVNALGSFWLLSK